MFYTNELIIISNSLIVKLSEVILNMINSVIENLIQGNKRFESGNVRESRYSADDFEHFNLEQHPSTVILTCSDSRLSPNIVFDQKLGELFVIQNAGAFLDETSTASLSFAVEVLKCSTVVVMGHTHCGAVSAAHAHVIPTESLEVPVHQIETVIGNSNSITEAVETWTNFTFHKTCELSFIKKSNVIVAQAIYDIGSGHVDFIQDKLQ